MKATAIAPANIAFVKYWGKSNDELTLPNNDSISMNLDSLWTKTTVEFSEKFTQDSVEIEFFTGIRETVSGSKRQRVIDQLDRLRKIANNTYFARVVSVNNFPAGVGIASSASAFCALTKACVDALGIPADEKQLSILTRLAGSGSATRSVLDGYVEWKQGADTDTSYAVQLANEKHWELYDLVLVVSSSEKKSSSLEGHESVTTTPYYETRLEELPKRLELVRQAIKERNFTLLGLESEKDAVSLHMMAMTAVPAIYYWNGATMDCIAEVFSLREQGIECYFTIDAGPNVHVLCEKRNKDKILEHFQKKTYITQIFVARSGKGVRSTTEHLF